MKTAWGRGEVGDDRDVQMLWDCGGRGNRVGGNNDGLDA